MNPIRVRQRLCRMWTLRPRPKAPPTMSNRFFGVVAVSLSTSLGSSCADCQSDPCAPQHTSPSNASDAGKEPDGALDAASEPAAPSCDNRKRDPGEEAIDCGGPCPACPFACLYTETYSDPLFATLASWTCEPSLSLETCQRKEGYSNCGENSYGEYHCVSDSKNLHHLVQGGVCDEILQAERFRVDPITRGSCDDGVQSLLEQGVDCGGFCEACPPDQAVCVYKATLLGPKVTLGPSQEGWKCKEIEDLQTCRESAWSDYRCSMSRCWALLADQHEIVPGPCVEALAKLPAQEQ